MKKNILKIYFKILDYIVDINSIIFCIRKKIILNRIRHQDKVRVVFFAINLGMWKNDELFRLMINDNHFDPIIVSYVYDNDSIEYKQYVQQTLRKYFDEKGFPFIEGYNILTGKYYDVRKLNPDIIFYAQPYDDGCKIMKVKRFAWNSLFCYIPYCIQMEQLERWRNLLYSNICWQMYYPTVYSKNEELKNRFIKTDNIIVTGPLIIDSLNSYKNNVPFWKIKNKKMKKIIWAPHHSIFPNDPLQYSNFLEIADDMILLAQKYKNLVEFAFKPHPRLKDKLIRTEDWGLTRTEEYYQKWVQMDNTMFVEGDYSMLFISSDALIHDCSTFMFEYLFTYKPVLFVAKDNSIMNGLNELGKDCFKLHYKARTIDDIEAFINNVVLSGEDIMASFRTKYIERELACHSSESVANNIYKALKNGLL